MIVSARRTDRIQAVEAGTAVAGRPGAESTVRAVARCRAGRCRGARGYDAGRAVRPGRCVGGVPRRRHVVFSAWKGGLGGGMPATVLSSLVRAFFFSPASCLFLHARRDRCRRTGDLRVRSARHQLAQRRARRSHGPRTGRPRGSRKRQRCEGRVPRRRVARASDPCSPSRP